MEVLVDDTTRPDLGHRIAVESRNFSECTRSDTVATVLGEEDGDGVVGKLFGTSLVTRFRVGRVTAPGVDVVTEEINTDRLRLAVNVVGQVSTDGGNVSGGVSHTNGTVSLVADVGFHITDGSFDVGHGLSGSNTVSNFIASKEAESVVVTGHGVNDTGVAVVQGELPGRITAVDGDACVGEISNNVDASVGEKLHAIIVIGCRVNVVGTNDVGAQLLHVGDVALAGGLGTQGVGSGALCFGELVLNDIPGGRLPTLIRHAAEEAGTMLELDLIRWKHVR